MLNQFSDQILIVTVPETLEMVDEVYWKVTKPMELHYQTFFRKKLTDIKGISDQKADKIQSEERRNCE